METEVLIAPDHLVSKRYEISPALLAQAPETVVITTRRGREVPLALAGYRLRMGGTYQVRVTGGVRDVRLIGFPRQWVQRQGEPREGSDDRERYWFQEFRVCRAGLLTMLSNLGICPDELEIESTLRDDRKVSVCIPVVLEVGFTWKIVLLLMLWAFFLSVSEVVSAAVWDHRTELLSSPVPWLRALALAVLYPVITFFRRVHALRKRARELRENFGNRWTRPEPGGRVNSELHGS